MAADFYRRLFAADHEIEALFATEPEVMAMKFSDELAAIVEAIVDFDVFAPRLQELASRHVAYGVEVRHALLGALAAALAPVWDDEMDTAWRHAYDLVAELMMAAAAWGGDR